MDSENANQPLPLVGGSSGTSPLPHLLPTCGSWDRSNNATLRKGRSRNQYCRANTHRLFDDEIVMRAVKSKPQVTAKFSGDVSNTPKHTETLRISTDSLDSTRLTRLLRLLFLRKTEIWGYLKSGENYGLRPLKLPRGSSRKYVTKQSQAIISIHKSAN